MFILSLKFKLFIDGKYYQLKLISFFYFRKYSKTTQIEDINKLSFCYCFM